MMQIFEEIEQGHLFRLFDIDLEAGQFFWKEAPRTHPRLKGLQAGSARATSSGKLYWVIKIGGKAHKRARLIYLAAHGRLPVPCVDHINGCSTDDRVANLREATVTENAWNHKTRARRLALPMGVRSIASGRFQSRISYHGKQLHLGAFDTPEQAHAIYLEKRKELYGEFA